MKRFVSFALVLVIGLYVVSRMSSAPAGAAPATINTPATTSASGHAAIPGVHTITGKQSLSAAFIDQVLASAHSPMQGDGAAFVQLGDQSGIDAAYVLAIFHHESGYGTTGEARASRSPGNTRCLDRAHYGDLQTWCQDAYAWFPTWYAGLVALYRLLAGPLYVSGGLVTIEQVIPRWAPPGDHNNDSAYIAAVLEDVSSWRASA